MACLIFTPNYSVLKERIANLKLDRTEILRREAALVRRIDDLVLRRNKLNAFRRYLDKANYGVVTIDENIFGQHVAVQESVQAADAQYLDAKILDLQRQRMLWESERTRKKLLCQRLQDEYEADTRRNVLCGKVKAQLNKRGLVATLELLAGVSRPTAFPLRTRSSTLQTETASRNVPSSKSGSSNRRDIKGDALLISKSNKSRIAKEFFQSDATLKTGPLIGFRFQTQNVVEDADDGCKESKALPENCLVSQSTNLFADEQMELRSYAQEIAYVVVIEWVEEALEGRRLADCASMGSALDDAAVTPGENISGDNVLTFEESYTKLFDDTDGEPDIGAVQNDELSTPPVLVARPCVPAAVSPDTPSLGEDDAPPEMPLLKRIGYDVSVSAYRVMRTGLQRRHSSLKAEFKYAIITIDPTGVHWTIDKSFNELKGFHRAILPFYVQVYEARFNEMHGHRIQEVQTEGASSSGSTTSETNTENEKRNPPVLSRLTDEAVDGVDSNGNNRVASVFSADNHGLPFPPNLTVLYPTLWHHMERAKQIQSFLTAVLDIMEEMSCEGQNLISNFLEIAEVVPAFTTGKEEDDVGDSGEENTTND
jgi:hypothetical protein